MGRPTDAQSLSRKRSNSSRCRITGQFLVQSPILYTKFAET